MLILPTLGRPHNLKRFIEAYNATKASVPVYVVFNYDDAEKYEQIILPEHWKAICAPAKSTLGNIYRMMFKSFPNEAFYGLIADDVVPETPEWDMQLLEFAMQGKIAWGFDGGRDETLPRHPFISGELVRKWGWIAPPELNHCYVDNAWRDLGKELDCLMYLKHVKMLHLHPDNNTANHDDTYLKKPDIRLDKVMYESWKRFELPLIVAKAKHEI
jgi:hypothetical protein